MKKKRRYERRKTRPKCHDANVSEDRHHLLWMRRSWGKNRATNSLRNHWYMIAIVPRDTLHPFIHSAVEEIPVPKEESARFALEQLALLEQNGDITDADDIEKRLKVLLVIFYHREPKTCKALKKQLDAVREYYY